MSITDEHGRQLASGSNGESKTDKSVGVRREQVSVRAVPTGTLIWNLFLTSNAEQTLIGQIRQLQMIKQMQKMVDDPPQMQEIVQQYGIAERERYTIAKELNERFRDMDLRRCAEFNIELYDPPPRESADDDAE